MKLRLGSFGLCALLGVACGTIPTLSDGGAGVDSSTEPGDARATVIDAPATGTDGGPVIEPGPVDVTVTSRGNPVSGMRVAVNWPDGNRHGEATTTTSGTVHFNEVPVDAIVTILASTDPALGVRLFTVAGVQPFDHLSLDLSAPTTVGKAFVYTSGPYPGATYYKVDIGGCQSPDMSTQTSFEIGLQDHCLSRPDSYGVVALALEKQDQQNLTQYLDGTPLAFAVQDPVSLAGGSQQEVGLGEWSTRWNMVTMVPTSLPAGAFLAYGAAALKSGSATFDTIERISVSFGGGTPSAFDIKYPSGIGDRVEYTMGAGFGQLIQMSPPEAFSIYTEIDKAGRSEYKVDLASTLLPRISKVSTPVTGPFPRVTWSTDITQVTKDADAAGITLTWNGADANAPNRWTAILPADIPTDFQFPELELGQTSANMAVTVTYVDAQGIASFGDVKSRLSQVLGTQPFSDADYPVKLSAGGALDF